MSFSDLGFTSLITPDPSFNSEDLGFDPIVIPEQNQEEVVIETKQPLTLGQELQGLGKGIVRGVTPTLDTESRQRYLKKEAEATPEELIDIIGSESEDIIPYSFLPTSKQVEETIGSKQGGYGESVGESLGGILKQGGLTPGAALSSTAGALAGESVRQAGGGELGGFAADIGASLLAGGLEGLLKKGGQKVSDFAKRASSLGLTPAQIQALEKGSESRFLGKIVKQGSFLDSVKKDVSEGTSQIFDAIESEAQKLPSLTKSQSRKLASGIQNVVEDLKSTLSQSTDEKAVQALLEGAIKKLEYEGASAVDIVNFYRTINKNVNWNSINRGQKRLVEVKELLKEGLKEIDPKFYKNFSTLNETYAKQIQFLDNFSQTETQKALETIRNYTKFPQILYGLVTNNPGILLEVVGEDLFRRSVGRGLFDPKVTKIMQYLLNSAKMGSVRGVQSAERNLLKQLGIEQKLD